MPQPQTTTKKGPGTTYGLKYAQFATIKSHPENGRPIYEKDRISLGGSKKCSISITKASGELHQDDALALKIDEFVSGKYGLETGDVDEANKAKILGAKMEGNRIKYNEKDVPPQGGVSFYVPMRSTHPDTKGQVYYRCVHLPVVQAEIGDEDFETKEGIKFGVNKTDFTIFKANDGDWKETERVETEAEAIKWCDDILDGTATTPTPPPVTGGD